MDHKDIQSRRTAAPFPVEVFEAIFQHLSPIELSRLAQTNRTLNRIATTSGLWERAYLSFWPEEDVERGRERGTLDWRNACRHGQLFAAARQAWEEGGFERSERETFAGLDSIDRDDGKRKRRAQNVDVPFPFFLSATASEREHQDELQPTPRFYDLFCKRIRADQEVLDLIEEQCKSATGWIHCIDRIVTKYGNDVKDLLHALVCVQQRSAKIAGSDSASNDFPTAFQLRLREMKRSQSHHLTLLHLARELLEHLQSREAMKGLIAMRPDTNAPPVVLSWTELHPVRGLQPPGQAKLQSAQLAKQYENGLCWLSMFRGGEGQEISCELDVLATSCALFLARSDVQIKEHPRAFAVGICNFMQSRGFRGAGDGDFHNLDNNFIHLCLDESGRESLPLTLVVIFCSIAARLGLSAFPTNTPGKILAVVNVSSSAHHVAGQRDAPMHEDRFWVNVYSGGQIHEPGDMIGPFGPRLSLQDDAMTAQSSPASCCLRAARNVITSVQRAQVLPTVNTNPVGELVEDTEAVQRQGSYVTKAPPDQRFERLMMAPNTLFNPRRTFLHPRHREIHLVSPFWTSDLSAHRLRRTFTSGSTPIASAETPFLPTPGRFQRVRHWSEATQHASMHAASNALTRLGDELGERGLAWSMGLVCNFFPLDILVMHDELTGYQDPQTGSRSPLYIHDPERRQTVVQTRDDLLAEDLKGPESKRREQTESYSEVKPATLVPSFDAVHPVGTIFVHRLYRYRAVLVKWDGECSATEGWIVNMGVDTLPNGGRNQPFYQSLVEDGSTRYVAHCNIQPANFALNEAAHDTASRTSPSNVIRNDLRLDTGQLEKLLAVRGVGRMFRCATFDEDGTKLRLVRNAVGNQAFPNG